MALSSLRAIASPAVRAVGTAANKTITSAASQHWRRWAVASNNRRIFTSALVVGVATFGVMVTYGVRDLFVAASFGASPDLDAYLLAYALHYFLVAVIAGSFDAALTPIYVQVKARDGERAAQRLLGGILFLALCLLAAASLAVAILSPVLLPIIASGFTQSQIDLTQRLLFIMMPLVLVGGVASIWVAVLNACEQFAWAAIAPVTIPDATMLFLVIASPVWGIHAFAFGYVAGIALHVWLLGLGLRRVGVRLTPHWPDNDAPVRLVIGQYASVVAGIAITTSIPLINQFLAATLVPGSVAALGYGSKIVAVVMGTCTMALGTVIFPYFSKAVALGDYAAVRHTLRVYTKLILGCALPITIGLAVFAEDVVRLVLERGAFSRADTQLVAPVLALYVVQLPFASLAMFYTRLLSAMKANRVVLYGSLLSFSVNLLAAYVLKDLLGVSGIALAMSITSLVSLGFLSTMLHLLLRKEGAPS